MNAKELLDTLVSLEYYGYNLENIDIFRAYGNDSYTKGEYSDAVFSTNRIDYSEKKLVEVALHERKQLILM